jgi:hypothetical protein
MLNDLLGLLPIGVHVQLQELRLVGNGSVKHLVE